MAASKVGDQALGNLLKETFINGVMDQMSKNSVMWDFLKKHKKGSAHGKNINFALRTTLGYAAVGSIPVVGGDLPDAQQATIVNGVAYLKDFGATIKIEDSLWEKAKEDVGRYGEPLAEETDAKSTALARYLSTLVYQDGTGIIGTASAIVAAAVSQTIVIKTGNTDRGFIGWFNLGDLLRIGSGLVDFTVASINRESNSIVVKSVGTQAIAVNDTIRRKKSATDNVTLSIPSSDSSEWSDISTEFHGLEAYNVAAGATRLIHGIHFNDSLAISAKDAGGMVLDSTHFQRLVSKINLNVGVGKYKYSKAIMSNEALDALVEAREADRRFITLNDTKRGAPSMGYVAGKTVLEFDTDEFCPHNRIWVLPDGDAIEYYGKDFEFLKNGGSNMFQAPTAAGSYARHKLMFLTGYGLILVRHPAALGLLHNFTIA
jgi:hypothetical protein